MASLVIKVKYEETLRRFNVGYVAINGDRRLDLSIEGLRLKICSLFNLPSDSQFRLTYKDEDDDLVTLVDDDDLHDVVSQGLDPVRITVHLISKQRPQSSSAHSSGTSLENSSVGNDTKPGSNGRKHEGVKSDGIEKRREMTGVGVSAKPPLYPSVSLDKGKHSSYKSSSNNWSKSAHGIEYKDIIAQQREYAKRAAGFQTLYPAPAYDQSFKPIHSFKQVHSPNRNSNKTDNTTSIVHTGITCDGCGLHPISGPRFKSKVRYDYDLCRCCFLHEGSERDYTRIDFPMGNKPPQSVKASDADNIGSIFHKGITCDGCGIVPISGPRFKSKVKYNYDLCNICFSQSGNDLEYVRIDVPLTYHHLDRAPDVHLGVIIHNGVFCNGCGVFPIRGERFKSKVRHDYDLCTSCFLWTMGNDATDYLRISRIDSPLAHKHPRSVRVPDVMSPRPYMAVQWKFPALKLDSCLIKDVSIPKGTTMAPLTPFTKIWRMRNTGTQSWFSGLHLIWVGGDRLSPSVSVEIQVPAFGVDGGQELDIAVGFIAPELPGLYTSSWKMVYGQSFGQQVSVQIQVDPSVDLTREIFQTWDLNLPPISSETVFPDFANVKAEPELDIEVTNSSGPSVVDQNPKIQMIALNLDINDMDDFPPAANSNRPGSPAGPLSEADASSYSIPEGSTPTQSDPTRDNYGELLPSSVSYPEADVSSYSIPEASTPVQSDPTSDDHGEVLAADSDAGNFDNINLEQVNKKTGTEEKLLKELEQIGFKQIDSDKEVDSEQSVDDLSDKSADSDEEVDSEQSVDDLSDDSDEEVDSEQSVDDLSDVSDDLDEDVNSEQSVDDLEEVDSEQSVDDLSDVSDDLDKEVDPEQSVGDVSDDWEKEVDPEQSVDDVSNVSDDWDPILEELTEMGFQDKDTNKKLLEKNNGSITRVVMDLIAEEKA